MGNLEQEIKENKFIVFLQGKYDTNTEKIVGAEALIRKREGNQIIPPNEFIPYYEQTGEITKLDKDTNNPLKGAVIGLFDNKQKKKKVNKNVQEKKDKELSFYYNTIYIKDNSLNEELIEDFKECGYKNKSDYLNLLIKKGLESKRKEKDILDNEGVTSAVKELITKVESLEKVVLSEQETFIKLINEVFKNE